MGPFDRFNDRAKRVLALAQDEAIRFNHNYIGTEHLLLGLVREGEGVAARVLDSLGVELSKVRTAVEFIIGRGDSTTSPSEITLSPRTKKVIELAIDEARKLGHSHVGTEHLLLGVAREGGSIGAKVLESLGLTLEKVSHQVIATMGMPSRPATAVLPQIQFGRATATMYSLIGLAREEALGLGHDWIGTEHLLLALLRAETPTTAKVLEQLGVTYEKAVAQITKVVPRKEGTPTNADLTPRSYSVIGYAKGFADGEVPRVVPRLAREGEPEQPVEDAVQPGRPEDEEPEHPAEDGGVEVQPARHRTALVVIQARACRAPVEEPGRAAHEHECDIP